VKPYAVAGLHEELDILSDLTLFLEENEEFYGIGDSPISQMFRDIRAALEREIKVTEEQRNFIRAGEYYSGSKLVKVPEIYGASNESVTFMEFVPGPKIIDAYPDDPAARAELARRLSDALTYDVIFSPADEAVFHGDPHAGNVHVMEEDPVDPYRIVLLDWGLTGEVSRADRRDLVQLFVGFAVNDRRRVHDHVGALLADPLPESRAERRRIEQAVDDALWSARGKGAFSQIVTICGVLSHSSDTQ
jgi:ubiquinone biosynthesis protein